MNSYHFTEGIVEDAALVWLEALGYAVPHGLPDAGGKRFANRVDPRLAGG